VSDLVTKLAYTQGAERAAQKCLDVTGMDTETWRETYQREFAKIISRETQDLALLEALETVWSHGTDSLWIEDGKRMSMMSIVRAAIDKARGRQ
jgi:hypothetical protein